MTRGAAHTAGVGVPSEHVTALRSKYLEIRRMRMEHSDGAAASPREDMATLADRFPGALRELDELSLTEVDARIHALDRALRDPAELPQWAVLLVAYHGWMRAALRVKRLAAGASDHDAAYETIRSGYDGEPDEPPVERWDRDTVRAAIRPPGGRLHSWVCEQIAVAHGLEAADVDHTLFPNHATRRLRAR